VAHYVTLMRWTTQGYAGLPSWRERVEEGEQIIAEAGGKLVGVYVTLGRYDVVEIFELVLLVVGGKDGYVERDGHLVDPERDLERRREFGRGS
jgi:hypothetical protein